MKKILLILLYFLPLIVYSQETTSVSRTDTIGVGLTTYPFFYNIKFKAGSTAIGPSLYLSDGKLTVQISLLVGVKTYITYEGSASQLKHDTIANRNIFFPMLLHYNYFSNRKVNCFFTAGFILGGQYYLDENNTVKNTNGINFIIGSGVSAKIINNTLYFRASPTIRYSEKNFFPGLLLDLTIPIKRMLNKNTKA